MEAYSAKWNVFAIDVKNEPNGIATWVRACLLRPHDRWLYLHDHDAPPQLRD